MTEEEINKPDDRMERFLSILLRKAAPSNMPIENPIKYADWMFHVAERLDDRYHEWEAFKDD